MIDKNAIIEKHAVMNKHVRPSLVTMTTLAAVAFCIAGLSGCRTGNDRQAPTRKPDPTGSWTELHQAARSDHLERAKALLADGADVNVRTTDGQTPLSVAAFHGMDNVAALLIANGADINNQDDAGLTPLHCAVMKGRQPIVQMLLDAGAEVNARDIHGRTSLTISGWSKISEMLKQAGGTK